MRNAGTAGALSAAGRTLDTSTSSNPGWLRCAGGSRVMVMAGAPGSIDTTDRAPKDDSREGGSQACRRRAGMKKAGGPDPALRLPASGLRLLEGHEGHRPPALRTPELGARNRSEVAAAAARLKVCIRSDYSW